MKDGRAEELEGLELEALNEKAPQDYAALIQSLRRVTERLKRSLVPVQPRGRFIAHLRSKLMREAHALAEQQRAQQKERLFWVAVGIGSLIYIAGLLAMGVRSAIWLLGAVAALIGWRRRPTRTA